MQYLESKHGWFVGALEIHSWELENQLFSPGYIIDMRSAEQFSRGHIPNACNVPYECFQVDAEPLVTEGVPILVVDEGGARAAEMAVWLRARGWDGRYLSGGMSAWRGVLESS
jgi:rhodanese-related sulfurtransferase